ncbi:MAG: hypothetical protein KA603_03155 [Azonexus sp.]|nr:hypothetical protein [Betaproteobacteria bacterium]MBK8917354.1 hypothetical protein [Betaproteobacteria bacterium]MBP6035116.1 hypothetical protein [Azonexus sp.]MBP6905906.1 hypothetical protein [Azonexus sp.]
MSDADREARNCFPARYLELWRRDLPLDRFLKRDAVGRYQQVDAEACGIPRGFLDPLQRRTACLDPKSDKCSDGHPPWLGVALEGGGTKSAPFALGVLAGLQQAGLLDKAEIVASVSGGGYAAHYYFSRLMDAWEARPVPALPGAAPDPAAVADNTRVSVRSELPDSGPQAWFRDCIPHSYHCGFAKDLVSKNDPRLCRPVQDGDPSKNLGKDYQYWEQIVHYTDLTAPFGSWRRVSTSDWAGSIGHLVGLFGLQMLTLPAHHLAHTLFSWPENFAPSREAYRAGIERAYGHTTTSWQAAMALAPEWVPPPDPAAAALTSADPAWDDPAEPLRRRGSHTLERLGYAYRDAQNNCQRDDAGRKACGFPLWISGTANTAGRSLESWLVTPERDSLRFLFETTPFSQGSGTFGWADSPYGPWLMRDAAGASAAFLDDEQRRFGTPPWRTLVSTGLHLFNLNWGTDIPNFAVSDERRALYRFMPWPLYTLPVFQGREAPYIHLTDGGNSDNLALMSLLRRGVKHIVVAASTDDEQGEFPSLCEAKNQLELDGSYRLLMPELQDFDRVCAQQVGVSQEKTWGEERVKAYFCERAAGSPTGADCDARWRDRSAGAGLGYNLWDWPTPVLQGCVVRDEEGQGASCEGAGSRLLSRLYVVKPAINLKVAQQQVELTSEGTPNSSCGGKLCTHEQSRVRSCPARDPGDFIGPPLSGEEAAMALPCTAMAFLNANYRGNGVYGEFPQHNFLFMTLNSSHTMYSAYYDLARHYTRQIGLQGDSLTVPRGLCPETEGCRIPLDEGRRNCP